MKIMLLNALILTLIIQILPAPTEEITETDLGIALSEDEYNCLYDNIHYEARGEGYKGMLAVAHVTVNRTKARSFPSSLCDVVYQRMQFEWTRKQKPPISNRNNPVIQRVIIDVIHRSVPDPTGGALWFHSVKIEPDWAKQKQPSATIRNHAFYTDV